MDENGETVPETEEEIIQAAMRVVDEVAAKDDHPLVKEFQAALDGPRNDDLMCLAGFVLGLYHYHRRGTRGPEEDPRRSCEGAVHIVHLHENWCPTLKTGHGSDCRCTPE